MEAVIDALKQFLGEYIVAVAILIIAFAWFIWWLSSKYHSIKAKVNGIDELPCKAHDESMSKISERLDETGRLLAEIQSRLNAFPCKAHDESLTRISERLDKTGLLLAGIESRMNAVPCKVHDESLSKLSERIEENGRIMSGIESKLEALPCSTHSDRHDRHEERMNKSDALLNKIEGQLELLVRNSVLNTNGRIMDITGSALSDKHSPRVLNENGLSLLNDCGGNEFLSQHMEYFIGKLEKLQPKTALDVESLSIAVVQAATVEDIFIPLKNWVYEAPRRMIRNSDGSTREWDVTLNDVIFVLALPIRDKYLETHSL